MAACSFGASGVKINELNLGYLRPKLRALQPLHGLRAVSAVRFDDLVLSQTSKKPIISCQNSAPEAVEILDLKRDLEGVRSRENEKGVKLEAMEKEKALVMSKVEKLEKVESSLRVELMGKEREIQVLRSKVEELEVVVGNSKSLEMLKNKLETKIVIMKAEIIRLESSLDEKEKKISGLETKERAIRDDVNDINFYSVVDEGGKKGIIGGSKQWDWLIAGGSTIAVVAALGVAYIRSARRH